MAVRVFIYGSCVSRDAVAFWAEDQLQLASYVTRKSLISAMAPSGDADQLRLKQIYSSFQRRMARGDVESSLVPTLIERKDAYDMILWDLTDERNGVQQLPDGGIVTRVPNLSDPGMYRGRLGPAVTVDVPEHAWMWNRALDEFLGTLSTPDLLDRLVLNDTRWAPWDNHGAEFTEDELFLNPHLERMSRAICSAGVPVIAPEAETVVAAVDHQWGWAHFHYVPQAYASMSERLLDISRRWFGALPG